MNNKANIVKIVLEVLQWLLIASVFVMYLIVYSRVTEHLHNEKDAILYEHIDNSKRIERLNGEKMALIDSISSMSKDTVYIIRYKAIVETKQTTME
jgi:hypothetical protein